MLFVETIATEEMKIEDKGIPQSSPRIEHAKAEGGIIHALDMFVAYNQPVPLEEKEHEDWVMMDPSEGHGGDSQQLLALKELWDEKVQRIRSQSPFASHPNWLLRSFIVKSGDDLRQEQLAMQLIQTFHGIFKDAELPLWLRPYNVVALSSTTGLIEAIPDTVSIDSLKKRIPNMTCLSDYFEAVYGDRNSVEFIRAQRNFVESLAGYSLVCYILQIKDRHNGNILLDKDGHIIHIDYGFMLSGSPGSLNFEADFKITKEFVDVMGGEHKDMFNYFRLLFIRGFLEVRKHYQKFILLTEMMLPGHKLGCFSRRELTIRELKDRFQMNLTDKEAIAFVGNLIRDTVGSWRTGSYDNFQYYTNGILV